MECKNSVFCPTAFTALARYGDEKCDEVLTGASLAVKVPSQKGFSLPQAYGSVHARSLALLGIPRSALAQVLNSLGVVLDGLSRPGFGLGYNRRSFLDLFRLTSNASPSGRRPAVAPAAPSPRSGPPALPRKTRPHFRIPPWFGYFGPGIHQALKIPRFLRLI